MLRDENVYKTGFLKKSWHGFVKTNLGHFRQKVMKIFNIKQNTGIGKLCSAPVDQHTLCVL